VRLGVEDRGIAVAVDEGCGEVVGREALDLVEDAADGVLVHLLEDALAELLLESEQLEQVELDVADVALVVAHAGYLFVGLTS
jgi:hypothetical protein